GAKYLYVSTCGLYDPKTPEWKDESAKIETRTPYFSAKRMGEDDALTISGGVIRISSPFGEGMASTLVLSRFIDAALRGQLLSVWGGGTREQDFISVDDIGEGIVQALFANVNEVFNIASGRPISMAELAELVVSVCGRGEVVQVNNVDPLDGYTARFDVNKARRWLNWTPKLHLREFLACAKACASK
ncbi:NAD-dependent epimerase/dehydratase family protein, partial [Bradyrhizobium sp.]|uniref:NAD-dependent epimerase/dehydratase family protein n=1 Tax=Bradyrhizobium sp. TaxID=376 RepID=UPI003C70977A